jgi:ABC-2 type transport system permease protein
MDNFRFRQFHALLKREVIEHTSIFVIAPLGNAAILLLIAIWIMHMLEADALAVMIEYVALLFDGLSPTEMAPLFMVVAIPFVMTLGISAVVYLLGTLYQDRKDASVLFWHSMPVSNLQTIVSKVVAIVVVAPAFYMACLFALYAVLVVWLSILGASYDIEVAGLGYMFMAAVVSLLLVYLSAVVAGLWLLPTLGWLMLFSSYASRAPAMWALGVFAALLILEDFIFGSQFLANWIESRANPAQYIIFSFSEIWDRLFSYDMLFGVAVGCILLTGAVMMRRYTD